MPQTQTILQVFVASPSDVAEERKILESVIDDINRTARDAHPVRLELLKWETHARPGFGEDAQDVINQQIGDKYDIFLGIMWGRFGSPTPRAESGTEEEFNRALSRWEGSPERIQIMFYFKNAGIPPSELDPEQLAQVQAFKKKISSQGVYSEFQDAEDFRTQARRHLTKVIQDWRKRALSDPETAETTTPLRVTRAIEQLGDKENMVIRLGGIYDLEQLAKDSEKDHGRIMEVLTAYVRENAPVQMEYTPQADERPPTDMQAILTVLGRRETTGKNRRNAPLDLSNTQLIGADLREADLRGADLSGADLREADLDGAKLNKADLTDADLDEADLTDADLRGADLTDADLRGADLDGADLRGADLDEADLDEAENLTAKQVRSAKNWRHADLPEDLQYLTE